MTARRPFVLPPWQSRTLEPGWASIELAFADLAVVLNITTFSVSVAALVALLIAVTLMHRPPTRKCHRCERRVRLDQRVCRHCGYDFEPVRTTR